jgi:ABC-type branched-subunit amino acid transport system ATPase component
LTAAPLRSPERVRRNLERLKGLRAGLERELDRTAAELSEAERFLEIADAVAEALDVLSEQLFGRLLRALEQQLTRALEEVLGQPIALVAEQDFKRGSATIGFHVERGGQREHIMRGQGGSVANVLSVGLRMFALATLDPTVHRPFLVLDEQDCWLQPELVPELVKIVHEAGRALGFQVLMISHHDVTLFERYADRIYRFTPTADGVRVERTDVGQSPQQEA